MTIKYDVSTTSVVVACSDCGHWRAFAFTREEAFSAGERHLVNVHDHEQNRAEEARRSYNRRRRHAVTA